MIIAHLVPGLFKCSMMDTYVKCLLKGKEYQRGFKTDGEKGARDRIEFRVG